MRGKCGKYVFARDGYQIALKACACSVTFLLRVFEKSQNSGIGKKINKKFLHRYKFFSYKKELETILEFIDFLFFI